MRTGSEGTWDRRDGARERSRGLLWAALASLVLHLLLFVIAPFLPVIRPVPTIVRVVEEEPTLRFDFSPPGDDVPVASGGSPIPVEATRASSLAPADRGTPDTSGLPLERPGPFRPPRAAPERPSSPGADRQDRVDSVEASSVSGAELRRDEDRGTVADTPSGGGPTGASSIEPRPIDINRAIRDFGEVLEEARERASAESGPRGRPSNVYVPDLGNLETTGFGVGNLVFETRDFDWSDYAREVYIRIWKAWHNRLLLTTADFEAWSHRSRSWLLEHQAQIRFVIESNGDVTEISVEAVSGCPPLDASAVDALAEVILPALPADFPKDREVVHARFIATGEVRSMRRILTWMKQRGYF